MSCKHLDFYEIINPDKVRSSCGFITYLFEELLNECHYKCALFISRKVMNDVNKHHLEQLSLKDILVMIAEKKNVGRKDIVLFDINDNLLRFDDREYSFQIDDSLDNDIVIMSDNEMFVYRVY